MSAYCASFAGVRFTSSLDQTWKSSQIWFTPGPASQKTREAGLRINQHYHVPSKYETFDRCCFKVGLALQVVFQRLRLDVNTTQYIHPMMH